MENQLIREQVFDVLFNYVKIADGIFTESDCATVRDEICLRIDQSQFTADEAEDYINQEVEKRIKERMPSEMTFEKAEIAAKETDYACFAVEPEGNEINFADAAAFYLEGWNACRSRLLLTQDQKKDKQQVDN